MNNPWRKHCRAHWRNSPWSNDQEMRICIRQLGHLGNCRDRWGEERAPTEREVELAKRRAAEQAVKP